MPQSKKSSCVTRSRTNQCKVDFLGSSFPLGIEGKGRTNYNKWGGPGFSPVVGSFDLLVVNELLAMSMCTCAVYTPACMCRCVETRATSGGGPQSLSMFETGSLIVVVTDLLFWLSPVLRFQVQANRPALSLLLCLLAYFCFVCV